MSQDMHENRDETPTKPELPTQAAPPPSPKELLETAAHDYTKQLDAEETNAPLERGLCLKFQKAWNRVHRERAERIPESGTLDRPTVRALNKLLRG